MYLPWLPQDEKESQKKAKNSKPHISPFSGICVKIGTKGQNYFPYNSALHLE